MIDIGIWRRVVLFHGSGCVGGGGELNLIEKRDGRHGCGGADRVNKARVRKSNAGRDVEVGIEYAPRYSHESEELKRVYVNNDSFLVDSVGRWDVKGRRKSERKRRGQKMK